jgi:hypothetical protein
MLLYNYSTYHVNNGQRTHFLGCPGELGRRTGLQKNLRIEQQFEQYL